MLSTRTRLAWDADFGSVLFAAEAVVATEMVRLSAVILLADIDCSQQVDANGENLVSVVLKKVNTVVAAVVETV